MNKFYSPYADFLQDREIKNLTRKLCLIKPDGITKILHNGRSYIDFSSNDYLGLKYHPEIIKHSQNILEKYGNGAGASRAVTGNFDLYKKLEIKIATWKGTQSALIMGGGFHCNASVIPALFDKAILGQEPLVFTDKFIHASMHQGCLAARIKQIRFAHNDTNHLKQLLEKYRNDSAPKFILTESVFSMDGDIAPLNELYDLRDEHNACLIVDEAHATGVLGKNGKGLAEGADIVIGTFGKALGSFGSYVASDKIVIDYLVQNCKGFIYSTALPPSVIGAIEAAIDLLPSLDKERNHVLNLARYFREELKSKFDFGQSETQIVPLIIGDVNKTMALSESLKEYGFWATAIRPPTVQQNASRIRFTFSAAHKKEDINKLLEVIKTT